MEILAFIVVAIAAVIGSCTQIYPGNFFLVLGSGIWAFFQGGYAWWFFAGTAIVIALSMVAKYLFPVQYLKRQGISNKTLIIGTLGAVIGFFLIPVIGIFVGFPIGVYCAEFLADRSTATNRTWTAIKGVGATILIELIATLLGLIVWGAGMCSL